MPLINTEIMNRNIAHVTSTHSTDIMMETFSALLAICAGNSPVPGEFPTQRPVTRSFDVFFEIRPNKRLSKQSWGWWFETPSRPLWRHRIDGWRVCSPFTCMFCLVSAFDIVLPRIALRRYSPVFICFPSIAYCLYSFSNHIACFPSNNYAEYNRRMFVDLW